MKGMTFKINLFDKKTEEQGQKMEYQDELSSITSTATPKKVQSSNVQTMSNRSGPNPFILALIGISITGLLAIIFILTRRKKA